MADDDAELIEEARRYDECVPWLRHCEAECCCVFTFRMRPDSAVAEDGREVRLRISGLADDLRRYYELHGARFEGDDLVLPRAACDFRPGRLWVNLRCSALQDDHLCALHPDRKPRVCRDLTSETATSGDYRLTERCLFAYRLRGERER